MSRGMRIVLIAVTIGILIGMIFLCTAMFSSNKGAPIPATTPVVEETEDCDEEDRAKKQVDECGIGVLIDPRKSTKPAVTTKPVAPVQTRCTPTRTRRC